MSKLYELVGCYRQFEDALDEYIEMVERGEMEEDVIWDTLDSIHGEIEEKADHIVQIIRNKQTFAASLEEEIKRLQSRKKAVDKGVDKLSDYLCETLSIAGIDKLETPHARFSFRSSDRCEISDVGMLLNFALANGRTELVTIPEPQPSKTAIKAALKSGEKIPGAIIVKARNLQIK